MEGGTQIQAVALRFQTHYVVTWKNPCMAVKFIVPEIKNSGIRSTDSVRSFHL